MTQAFKSSVCYLSLYSSWPPSPKWALKTAWAFIMRTNFVFNIPCIKQVSTTDVFHFKSDAVTAKKSLSICSFFGLKLCGYFSVSLGSLALQRLTMPQNPRVAVAELTLPSLMCSTAGSGDRAYASTAAAKASQDSFTMSCWLIHLFVWVHM